MGITRHKILESEFNILKIVHTKLINDYANFQLDSYGKMQKLRKELSDLKLKNIELENRIFELNIDIENRDIGADI